VPVPQELVPATAAWPSKRSRRAASGSVLTSTQMCPYNTQVCPYNTQKCMFCISNQALPRARALRLAWGPLLRGVARFLRFVAPFSYARFWKTARGNLEFCLFNRVFAAGGTPNEPPV